MRRSSWIIWVIPILFSFALYYPSLSYPFLQYDDWWLVHNPKLIEHLSLKGLWKVWFDFSKTARMEMGAEYLPVRDTFAAILYSLFGDQVVFYRITQILLYGISVSLFIQLLEVLGASIFVQWIAGLIFLSHPTHVEPVAWLSSQKDLLSLVFFLVTLLCYSRNHRTAAFVFFILALGSKYQVVILPFLLPMISSRRKPDVLFWLTAILGAVLFTFVGETVRYGHVELGPGPVHFAGNALALLWGSISNLFFPTDLQVLYPFIRVLNFSDHRMWMALSCLISFISLFILSRNRFSRTNFAILLILLGLLPMFRAPEMHLLADRYLLIPSLGMALLFSEMLEIFSNKKMAYLFATGMILSFSAYSMELLPHWKSDLELWTHAAKGKQPPLQKVQDNLAMQLMINHVNAGVALAKGGQFKEARFHFEKAVESEPNNSDAHFNLAKSYFDEGNIKGAAHELWILKKLAPEDERFRILERALLPKSTTGSPKRTQRP